MFFLKFQLISYMEDNIALIIKEDYDGSDNAATQSIDLVQEDVSAIPPPHGIPGMGGAGVGGGFLVQRPI